MVSPSVRVTVPPTTPSNFSVSEAPGSTVAGKVEYIVNTTGVAHVTTDGEKVIDPLAGTAVGGAIVTRTVALGDGVVSGVSVAADVDP